MASIFTFDFDPPRVASPWRSFPASRLPRAPLEGDDTKGGVDESASRTGETVLPIEQRHPSDLTSLDPEPQEGPVEYKLHLLLRPRRTFTSTSIGLDTKKPSDAQPHSAPQRAASEQAMGLSTAMSSSSVSRQHRLEQLRTQLLWRLQQSSPYHASSVDPLRLPRLSDMPQDFQSPIDLARLMPGLEESEGALYEIGVDDNGVFVGLAMDEMDESISNLRLMASSLGCSVQVLRMVPIGECKWQDALHEDDAVAFVERSGSLFVAEVYVKPELQPSSRYEPRRAADDGPQVAFKGQGSEAEDHKKSHSTTALDQLRVTLTGATTSGKSSLLGTLSTSTLDNGRGKSRLSLLKHRHEVASGVTSSVSQELIGYSNDASDLVGGGHSGVINYATADVTTWNDIHARSTNGRIAFISDSAGHPRYRRTTVRSLVGLVPHWTMLCVAADDGERSVGQSPVDNKEGEDDSSAVGGAHLSMAHLDLCLRLELPLVIVITKLDVAARTKLTHILSTLLSALKSAGRKPLMLRNDHNALTEPELQVITRSDGAEVEKMMHAAEDSVYEAVPIVFTSAIDGTGIGKLHALLQSLPIPPVDKRFTNMHPVLHGDEHPSTIFHVDDIFSLPTEKLQGSSLQASQDMAGSTGQGSIVSGHLEHGMISVGDEMQLGPFPAQPRQGQDEKVQRPPSQPEDPFLTPRSFNDAMAQMTASPKAQALGFDDEWRRFKIVSVRNLRMPVKCLSDDHVGTIGILPIDQAQTESRMQIQRGMVLARGSPSATHTVTARFDLDDANAFTVGTHVVLYSACVRVAAKVVAVAVAARDEEARASQHNQMMSDDGMDFGVEEEADDEGSDADDDARNVQVTFQLITSREWLQQGASLLVMPGGGPGLVTGERGARGLAGLEGYVGQIVETFG